MPLRVAELFAGVGGFRLGLEDVGDGVYDTVWFNQWEPGKRVQHAHDCYVRKLLTPKGLTPNADSNMDIGQVDKERIPHHDLLVGGFPCQDYSVATTLDKAGGLQGKKGVLWWQIEKVLKAREPKYVLLENVDRLLKSPASQRGRDFGVLLACLRDLDYVVEWRVINAAEYGNSQRRRRVFIFAAKSHTGIGKHIAEAAQKSDYLYSEGFFAKAFPTNSPAIIPEVTPVEFSNDPREVSQGFQYLFQNSGVLVGKEFRTRRVEPRIEKPVPLGTYVERRVSPEYFLDPKRLKEWEFQKGPKSEPRTTKAGFTYNYSEGGMQFPDLKSAPARTILTSEANRTPNRSTHVIIHPGKGQRHRFLTPTEVERLMGFPKHWTKGMPERWRYFTMGNALVVPLVTRMGNQLVEWVRTHEEPAAVMLPPQKASKPRSRKPAPKRRA